MSPAMSRPTFPLLLAAALAAVLPASAAPLLDSPQSGDPGIKGVSSISFGTGGLLLVADPTSASIIP